MDIKKFEKIKLESISNENISYFEEFGSKIGIFIEEVEFIINNQKRLIENRVNFVKKYLIINKNINIVVRNTNIQLGHLKSKHKQYLEQLKRTNNCPAVEKKNSLNLLNNSAKVVIEKYNELVDCLNEIIDILIDLYNTIDIVSTQVVKHVGEIEVLLNDIKKD